MVGDVGGAGLLPADAVHGDVEEHVELAQVCPVPRQPVLTRVALAVGGAILLKRKRLKRKLQIFVEEESL